MILSAKHIIILIGFCMITNICWSQDLNRYINGEKDGAWEVYYPSGALMAKEVYVQGKLTGNGENREIQEWHVSWGVVVFL